MLPDSHEDARQHTMFSITFADKADNIALTVAADGKGTATLAGRPDSRVHIYGTQTTTLAAAGPVAFALAAEPLSIHWGVVGKYGIYVNRRLTLTRTAEGGMSVALGLNNAEDSIYDTTLVVDKPVVCKIYRYGGEQRVAVQK